MKKNQTFSPEFQNSLCAPNWQSNLTVMPENLLEQLSGGRTAQCNAWRTICVVSGLGSFAGLFGALVFGPTTLACLLDTAIDFSHC